MNKLMKLILLVSLLSNSLKIFAAPRTESEYALKLYQKLAGAPPNLKSALYYQVTRSVENGSFAEAAQLVTKDPYFYSVTLRNFSAPWGNPDRDSSQGFNDLQAFVIGVVRDELDARLLLTGNFRYEGYPFLNLPSVSRASNGHYYDFEMKGLSPQTYLRQISPQWEDIPEAAGLLTTRAWAASFYKMGTNRLAFKNAMEVFLCSPLSTIRVPGLADHYVRRDVDRKPSGDPFTYQSHCRSCHAIMDGMSGAFARLDFVEGTFLHSGDDVVKKMNQNTEFYPDGAIVFDDSWVNLATSHQNKRLDWQGPLKGKGINSFGAMLADSGAFRRCMVKRVFESVCKKSPTRRHLSFIESEAEQFNSSGHNLRGLFARVAGSNHCIEHPTE